MMQSRVYDSWIKIKFECDKQIYFFYLTTPPLVKTRYGRIIANSSFGRAGEGNGRSLIEIFS